MSVRLTAPRSMALRRQRGLSLVELMVGVTVGLFIVAGAAMITGTQLGENRKLLLETQVQQDLRATADIVTRELRRAGYDMTPEFLVWSAAEPASSPRRSSRLGLKFDTVDGDKVAFNYDRPGGLLDFGYRLVDGTLRMRVDTSYQDLTDRNAIEITAFDVTREAVHTEQLACPKLCADGTQDCWPTASVTDVTVSITGRSTADANFVRTVRSRVRVRNDGVVFNVSPTEVCPT